MPEPSPTGGGLSISEAANYSGIGRTVLYGLIRDGQIRVVKVGRRSIVPRSEIDAFLARRLGKDAQ